MKITHLPKGLSAGERASANATRSYGEFSFAATFDPTSSSQVLLGYLPPGARPLDVKSYGGATGGTNPTIKVGTLADDDGYATALYADAAGASAVAGGVAGVLLNVKVTAETAVYGKVGGSAASGGTSSVRIHYVLEDY